MKVIILAANQGRQFGELTADIPKCMLPFGKETILQRQIRLLRTEGIQCDDIIVVGGYAAEKINVDSRVKVLVNENYDTVDNAYSLWIALQQVDDSVLILDGDLVYEEEVLKQVLACEEDAVFTVNGHTKNGDSGIEKNLSGCLSAIGKHILSDEIYSGIMLLKKNTASLLLEKLKKSISAWYTIALNSIVDQVNISVVELKAKVLGINSYFEYLDVKRIFGVEDYIIWVAGASGFLGKKIYNILKRNFNVVGTRGKGKNEEFAAIDLTDEHAVRAYVQLCHPKVIINAAGIAEPEKCDCSREKAFEINVSAVENLVKVCRDEKIKLIHISTDYVFDGEKDGEYSVKAARKPRNYYGVTKLLAEDKVCECPDSLIVRVPILYGYNGSEDKKTFPMKLIESLRKGQAVYLDNKQIRYPVLIDDVGFAIQDALHKSGIIHVSSRKPVTKYTWAKLLAKEFGLDEDLIQEDTQSDLADRPLHVRMELQDNDYVVTDVIRGGEILRKQCNCVFQLIYKSSPTEMVYGHNVGMFRYKLGRCMRQSIPQEVLDEIDCIVPVPNSGLYYAMGLAESSGIPYVQALYKLDPQMRSFQLADIALRERMIGEKIEPIKDLLQGKRIMLVDEAIFTGTTLKVVCDMVKACGVEKIFIALPTSVCRNQCRQYVQPERRLLAQDVTDEDIKDYFRVEGVFFQKKRLFHESVDDLINICEDCFD